MLPIRELLEAPISFEFGRKSKRVVATRRELTERPVELSQLRIADAMALEEFAPIRVRADEFRCYVYEWHHRAHKINVCVVVVPAHGPSGRVKELAVKQSFAPHVPGIPVDSGEIMLELGGKTYTLEAGLGDGYYPVYGTKPIFRRPTGIVVDFKLWQTRDKLVLAENQRLDEYGIVCFEGT